MASEATGRAGQGGQPERQRLAEDLRREKNWKRWGPYLSERQWGTVREDYSADGNSWTFFPFEHAAGRAYRWGEDGLLGWTDRECRLCFALALWNGRDPILKERLFGLSNPQGNHGEDVKESYFYLDSTPTHAYTKALYKYPQAEFPYDRLIQENARRGREQPEFELPDTGVFNDDRYFDVFAEYAKDSPDDTVIRLTVVNRGSERAPLDLLATLWFRNTWDWGSSDEDWAKPVLMAAERSGTQSGAEDGPAHNIAEIMAEHESLGRFRLLAGPGPDGQPPELLFTENQTNAQRLFGGSNASPFVKDAFHDYVIGSSQEGKAESIPTRPTSGTKSAACYRLMLDPGQTIVLKLRLRPEADGQETSTDMLGESFDRVFSQRQAEADDFYASIIPQSLPPEAQRVIRQAYAGLLWTEQFYFYVVPTWLDGDPAQPSPPPQRMNGRNSTWPHIFNRNVMSMPDKWEFPWYCAWDLGFQMVAFAGLDPDFAKQQLLLMLREWFQNPNGELPASEWDFSAATPPVHAWACWRTYKITGPPGHRDRPFLEETFQKLLLNFTWWVNRKDTLGRQIFSGGFLGMDNIGVFDRSRPIIAGQELQQADATAWMAFYCSTMLAISLELARDEPIYDGMASKFFNHFIAIADAINNIGGVGLWDEQDGLYYDQMTVDSKVVQLRIRSIVSLIPMLAVEVLDDHYIRQFPGFRKRMDWFLANRQDLAGFVSCMDCQEVGQSAPGDAHGRRLLAIPSRRRLERMLRYMLDENEFLSPHGIRSLSRYHLDHPFSLRIDGQEHCIKYEPGESQSELFGGNSNWRGPVWFPINYLLIECLERYHHFYGDTLRVECPTGSGRLMNLAEVASELKTRLAGLFLPDQTGRAPWQGPAGRGPGETSLFCRPAWRELLQFHEFFHGETGQGLGASHQTGWTALIARLLTDLGGRPGATGGLSARASEKQMQRAR